MMHFRPEVVARAAVAEMVVVHLQRERLALVHRSWMEEHIDLEAGPAHTHCNWVAEIVVVAVVVYCTLCEWDGMTC